MFYSYFCIYNNQLGIQRKLHENSPWRLKQKKFNNHISLFFLTFFVLVACIFINHQIIYKNTKIQFFFNLIFLSISLIFFFFSYSDSLSTNSSLWWNISCKMPLFSIKNISEHINFTQLQLKQINQLNNKIEKQAQQIHQEILQLSEQIEQKHDQLKKKQETNILQMQMKYDELEKKIDDFNYYVNKSDNLYNMYQISIKTLENSTQNNTSFIDSNRNDISYNTKKIKSLYDQSKTSEENNNNVE